MQDTTIALLNLLCTVLFSGGMFLLALLTFVVTLITLNKVK